MYTTMSANRVGASRWCAQWFTRGFTLLAMLFVLAGCAVPSTPLSPITPQPVAATPTGTITVVGDGTMLVQAKIAQINFAVEVVDTTVLAAHRTADETMQHMIETLASLEIAGEDIRPHSYNVFAERAYPDYERYDPGTVPLFPEAGEEIRYRVNHQLHVTIRNLNSITDVVAAVVEAGGNYLYIYSTDFHYDNPRELEAEARAKAVADAQRKAEGIAQQIGVTVGQAIRISELVQGTYSPIDSYLPPLHSRQLRFYMQLQIDYATTKKVASAATPAAMPGAATVVTATPSTGEGSAVTSSVSSIGPATGGDQVTIYGGDEATLREFLRQYHIQTFSPTSESSTAIYIGSLPPDLPFVLDLPTNLQVTGSVVNSGEYSDMQLLFSMDGDVNALMVALRQQLEQQGYSQPSTASEPQVFVPQPAEYGPLCSADGSLALILSGRNLVDGTGALRIYINTIPDFGGPCGQQSADVSAPPFGGLLPTLTPPVPISVFSSESGGGGNSYETTIRFTAETTIAELAAHYNFQLETEGWQQLSTSENEQIAWSGWTFTDGDQAYVAGFYIVRNPDSGERFQMTLRVDQAP